MQNYNYRKIFVISDLHFGVRNNSITWMGMMDEFFKWFSENVKKHGMDPKTDALFILGDIFHSRESINLMMLDNVSKIFQFLKGVFPNIHVIIGNHDTYYIDSNSITSVKLISDLIPGITCYYEPENISINGNQVLMLPWITSFDKIHEVIDNDSSDYLFCHMDINDMKYSSGTRIEKCADSKKLSKYKKIFSGHIHTRQDKGNVVYVGTPYQLDSSDYNNDKGYYIIDGSDFSYEFVQNEVSPKYIQVMMDDIMEMSVDEAKPIIDNNYVEVFMSRNVACNADLILFKQKLTELGIIFKAMNFTQMNDSKSIDDELQASTFDFNVYDACIKMLKDAKKADSEIHDTMEYFNILYNLIKNDTYDAAAKS